MKNFLKMSSEELLKEKIKIENEYKNFKSMNLKLNMARGVPSATQINLSNPMFESLNSFSDFKNEDGIDCRNYGGGALGITEAKRLLASLMDVDESDVIAGGSSSLQMMFDTVSMFMTHGTKELGPWIKQGKIKFLCPAPGYDRHFKICEYFGIEMVPIEMTPYGPDMDKVESLLKSDFLIKGMWCVPKFSNPQGICYSDETIKRIASIKPKATDFRVFWDNAYSVHDLTDENIKILSIMEECKKNNNEEMPIIFCSLSKITFAGAAIAGLACKGENLSALKLRYSVQSVGPNKLNQLAHVRFLKNLEGIKLHMEKHKKILSPKFSVVLKALKRHFGSNPILGWEAPKGGYFISVNTAKGCAKRTVELCKNAGVTLTDAGATYPYGLDPENSNIRLAPSFPSLEDLTKAIEIFCVSVKLAYLEKVLS